MLNTKKRVVAALVAALGSALAAAQGKFYVAGSLGATHISGDYTDQVIGAGQPQEGFAFVSAGRDGGSDVGGRLAVGYRVTESVALELGYANFGKHGLKYRYEKKTGFVPPDPFFRSSAAYELDGLTLDIVGTVPINPVLSFNGRAGVMATQLKYSEIQTFSTTGGTDFARTDRTANLHLGVGGTYQVNKQLGVTLDYSYVARVGKRFAWTEATNGRFGYGMLALGVRYGF